MSFKVLQGLSALALAVGLSAGAAGAATVQGDVPTGWVGVGNAGSGTADGVVVAAPTASGAYTYVSTRNGVGGAGSLPGVGGSGSPTDGSTLTTSTFSAAAGDVLEFYFNFVTSDGSGFADYAWARLLNGAGDTQVALLFTARTTPGSNTVPGFSMPVPIATLSPSNVAITPGGPQWSALGSDSGACYNGPAQGCGFTGWVLSQYTIASGGDYKLQFGVTNWTDTLYDTGMAIAGANIGGKPIDPDEPVDPVDPNVIPLPAGAWLLLGGLGGLATLRRRKRA